MTLFLTIAYGLFVAALIGNVIYLRKRPRVAPDREPSVSILIPARNEAANLRRLLPSLLHQTYSDFSVIVFDDNSEDETWGVLQSFGDARLTALRGEPLPEGWVGKVHALYQASRRAGGDVYLFLDADAELKDPEALRRLVEYHAGCPKLSVMTGLTHLRGRGGLLVSLVPFAILTGIPWPLIHRIPMRFFGALNGQCWIVAADLYHAHEPHAGHPDEVLEDVIIGRYFISEGILPYLVDVQDEVAVFMYGSLKDAWRGFRKNMYLVMGGNLVGGALFFVFFGLVYVAAPFVSMWFLLALIAMKSYIDRLARFSPALSLLAPASFAMALVLQVDSALHHWLGRASWKGRAVGPLSEPPAPDSGNEMNTSDAQGA